MSIDAICCDSTPNISFGFIHICSSPIRRQNSFFRTLKQTLYYIYGEGANGHYMSTNKEWFVAYGRLTGLTGLAARDSPVEHHRLAKEACNFVDEP